MLKLIAGKRFELLFINFGAGSQVSWIGTREELSSLILPSDARYGIDWEVGQRIVNEIFLLLQSDILRVAPKEIPANLPARLPRAILASRKDLSQEQADSLFNYLNEPNQAQWCQHDAEMSYLMARLLAHKYETRLLRGWRVVGEPWYSGYRADVGLINPRDECIIAVEIGNIDPIKLVEPFHNGRFRQLWHRPYYGFPDFRKYKWQRNEVYWVWARGRRWGQSPLALH